MKKAFTSLVFTFLIFSSTAQEKEKNSKEYHYSFENDTLLQTVIINFESGAKLSFNISSYNKKRKMNSSFMGFATLTKATPGADNGKVLFDEADEDMYGVLIYKYNEKFHLYIGVEKTTKKRLFIYESNESEKYHNIYAPFQSQGTLRLKKSK